MFFEKKEDLFIGRFAELFGNRVVFHGFSTRRGGVSDSPYHSLNLGYRTQDNPDQVSENRKWFFRALNFPEERVAVPQQVHGDRVVRITGPGKYSNADGLVTDTPGIGLVVQVADCLPIYLYDPYQRAVGLVHAGWRGSALRISAKAVKAMDHGFGTSPQDLRVFLGPSVGPCCYEVGSEVAQHFSAKYVSGKRLDLWQSNMDQLVDAGVRPERIVMSRLCTVCHPEWFFSHRASRGRTGRMMAVLGIREKKLDIGE